MDVFMKFVIYLLELKFFGLIQLGMHAHRSQAFFLGNESLFKGMHNFLGINRGQWNMENLLIFDIFSPVKKVALRRVAIGAHLES